MNTLHGTVVVTFLGSTVRELQTRIAAQVKLPSNYYINFGGQF